MLNIPALDSLTLLFLRLTVFSSAGLFSTILVNAPVVHLVRWQVLLLALEALRNVVIINKVVWHSMLTVEQMVLWASDLQGVWVVLVSKGVFLNHCFYVVSHLHYQLYLWTQPLLFLRLLILVQLSLFKFLFSLLDFGLSFLDHFCNFLVLFLSDSLFETTE